MPSHPLKGSPRISCDHACHLRRGSEGGTDYAVPVGTPIYAPFDGHVTRHSGGTGGWQVRVRNPVTGHDFWAFHLSGWVALRSTFVTEGTHIAHSGGAWGHPGSGLSTGPHVHAHVHDQTKRWGMEEYLAAFADLNPKPISRRRRTMSTLFKKQDEELWALAGDSPGTPANWLETRGQDFANQLAAQHGKAAVLSPGSWESWKRHYLSPLAIVAPPGPIQTPGARPLLVRLEGEVTPA